MATGQWEGKGQTAGVLGTGRVDRCSSALRVHILALSFSILLFFSFSCAANRLIHTEAQPQPHPTLLWASLALAALGVVTLLIGAFVQVLIVCVVCHVTPV